MDFYINVLKINFFNFSENKDIEFYRSLAFFIKKFDGSIWVRIIKIFMQGIE
jgi:hypothetical protein